MIINLNVLPALLWLLGNQKKNIRKEACWTISNITAGTAEQIEAVVRSNIFPKLIELLRSAEFDIQKEAAWAISNATSGGSPEQIFYVIQEGAIAPLCSLLLVSDLKVVTVVLEGLENMVKVAEMKGVLDKVVDLITDCGGGDAIEILQTHESKLIAGRAIHMLERYLGAEEEETTTAPDIVPTVVTNQSGHQQFQFGAGNFNNNNNTNFDFNK
jgi:importin subunit alpha-6/7